MVSECRSAMVKPSFIIWPLAFPRVQRWKTTDDAVFSCRGLLRDFGRWSDFFPSFEDRPVKSSLLMGDQERLVGCRRVLSLGHGKLVEQLVALDEDRQSL